MIKTICFDLGGEKELYLTIDEIIKLQAAFRFVCVDKYTEPSVKTGSYSDMIEAANKARYAQNNQINPQPPISNPFPLPDMYKIAGGLTLTTEELERQKQEHGAFVRAAEESVSNSIRNLKNGI